jgi:hypothetical protein
MKACIWESLVVSLLVFLAQSHSVQAQSGCSERPSASVLLEEEVDQIYPLINALPETQPPLAQGVFVEQVFEFPYNLGQQVWLASYIEGERLGDLCTDDLVEVAVWPSGQSWRHDFRSPDRQKILVSNAIDITHLFVPGINTITLTLTDLIGPALSTSGYALVVADSAIEPTATLILPTATAVPPTPMPQPVATLTQALPTATVTSTPVITLVLASDLPAAPVAVEAVGLPPTKRVQGMRLFGWTLAFSIGLIGLGVGVALVVLRSRRKGLPGTIDLYKGNQFLRTVVLAHFAKDVVRIGRRGDVALRGEEVADQVARLCTHHPTVALEILDPQDPSQIQERYVLNHGESHWIGDYRLEYKNYQQTQAQYSGGVSYVLHK